MISYLSFMWTLRHGFKASLPGKFLSQLITKLHNIPFKPNYCCVQLDSFHTSQLRHFYKHIERSTKEDGLNIVRNQIAKNYLGRWRRRTYQMLSLKKMHWTLRIGLKRNNKKDFAQKDWVVCLINQSNSKIISW